jgi:tetratricopeptide (TPR) repeat protein
MRPLRAPLLLLLAALAAGPAFPDGPASLREQARLSFKRGDFARAAALLEEELPLAERRAGASGRETLEVLGELAQAYQGLGKDRLVEESLSRLRSRRRPEAGDVTLTAEVLLRLGRHDEAFRETRRALELDPDNARSLMLLGHLHLVREKPAEAVPHLEKAAALQEDYGILMQLATAYQKAGRPREANETATRAVALCPTCAEAFLSLGYNTPVEEAEPAFKKALELDPDNAQMLRHLGSYYSRQGRTREAEEAYLRAWDLARKAGPLEVYEVVRHMTGIYRTPDKKRELEGLYDAALELTRQLPNDPRPWLLAGNLASWLHRKGAEAEGHYLRALELGDVSNAAHRLTPIYRASGRIKEAEALEKLMREKTPAPEKRPSPR